MPENRASSPRAALAVLAVGLDGVEWYDRDASGRVYHGTSRPAGPGAADLVAAAEEAVKASGGRRRPCVLAIDHTLSRHRLVGIPPVPRKELGRVFERKAKQLMETPGEDVLYVSLPMGFLDAESGKEGLRNWMLVGMPAGRVRALRLRLRTRGFRVRRVVDKSLAALCRGQAAAPDPDGPCIVVTVDTSFATVNLTHGDELVYRDRINGNILSEPALATSMIQVIRSCAAFWRKRSRGQQVDRVVLLGLPSEQGELLSHAILPAIPGGEVVVLPAGREGEMEGRYEYLESATSTGRLNPLLNVPLPMRKAVVGVLATLLLVASGGLAWTVHADGSTGLEEIRLETADLNARIADMGRYEEENRIVDAAVVNLRDQLNRMVEIGTHGVDLEDLLVSAVGAFRGRAVLSDVTVAASEEPGRETVTLRGEADPDPRYVLRDLQELTAALEDDARLADVTLFLPDRLPGSSDGTGSGTLSFSIEATLTR